MAGMDAMPNSNASEPPASPSRPGGRPRHQVKRSITELTSPVKRKSGHHARHSVHHHHHRRDRLHDDREPHTAHPSVNRHSLDIPRPEALGHSRRASAMVRNEDVSRVNSNPVLLKSSKDEKLREEQEKADCRLEDLKQSLVGLHAFSTGATRRLDETYYAVLEKSRALQNTIAALKDLAETSREIYGVFEKDSQDLENDITSQLRALGQFEDQETKIQSLQSRIRNGREKVQSLSERVDVVRNRVEGWERADQEWQDRTRRRLKVTWTVMVVIALAVVSLFLAFHMSESEHGGSTIGDLGESLSETLQQGQFNGLRCVPPVGENKTGELGDPFRWARPPRDDDRLRGFDEL